MRLSALSLLLFAAVASAQTKKIVLLAGAKDAGHPVGTHEYDKTVKAFKHCLENAGNVQGVRVEAYLNGWPDKPATLESADTIVLVSSGSDRKEADHPFLVGDRLAVIEKQMKRGCGLAFFHWSTFVPNEQGKKIDEWTGGHFDYQSGPAPKGWLSKIQTLTTKAAPGKHAIAAGMTPFEIKEEFYFNLRLHPKAEPVLLASFPKEGEQTVAYAIERPDGGRGFGFTGGHFFENWANANYRRMALNAILWTAKVPLPEGGVSSELPGERELAQVVAGNPTQVLIVTGHDHPAHNWRETSQMLKLDIEKDSRLKCRIVNDPEYLAREDLGAYGLIVWSYANWERAGLSDAGKANLLKYLGEGHGFAAIHFANGAFHPSLPKAKESDWPEYRKIVPRVWDHGVGEGQSGHDSYGPFKVEIVGKHPITDGLAAFDTVDELYFRQQGDAPIEVLATAKSKVTGKDEPMAWTSTYGKARVFQTVLGHSAESLKGDGPATLLRRGAAWAAGLTLKQEKPAIAKNEPKLTYGEGKFGKALDARVMPASVEGDDRYRTPPITVECWARLKSKSGFNVLVSSDPKTSKHHWELYSYSGTGHFSVYLPGTVEGEIKSAVSIADDQWRHVAMAYSGTSVTLYVDGKVVKTQTVTLKKDAKPDPGPLLFGAASSGTTRIGCDGLVDDVRISNALRAFTFLPNAPATRDQFTIGLWNLDGNEGVSADANWTPPTAADANEPWQKMTDKDWVDGRFQKTDTGPYLNATIDYPGPKGTVRSYKGTAIKVGSKGEGTFLFDRNTGRMAAGWTGGFLNHSTRRFGLLNTPTPNGKMAFATSPAAGWADASGSFDSKHPPTGPLPREWYQFVGLHLNGNRTVLEHKVHGIRVLEGVEAQRLGDGAILIRQFHVAANKAPLKVLLGELSGAKVDANGNITFAINATPDAKGANVIALKAGGKKPEVDAQGRVFLTFPASETPTAAMVCQWTGSLDKIGDLMPVVSTTAVQSPAGMLEGGEPRWMKPVETKLEAGQDTGRPFVVDTFTLPYENPWNALFFVTGVDFLPDGRTVICTAHGDVWTVKEAEGKLAWKRFATGIYQPLGLKVVGGKVVVIERGQLTRLHDRNNDGEADFYENLNSDWHTGGGEHSYDTCLETDPAGNFYFFKTGDDHTPTGGCLLKVSYDGAKCEILATGFRHPIGLGMSPDGRVTGADQEGNWMPMTRLDFYKTGGFYGDMRTAHRNPLPATYDPPLMWIPKEADNSAGGQVWVPEGKWGALGGKMLHLSYGRCRGYAVLPDGDKYQAGLADLGLFFLSGSARARFKGDEMYVVGLNGWQTAARKDGSLQRVRYTGKPHAMPVGFKTGTDEITITFDQPVEPADFTVERWNYIWISNYGSKHWSVANPSREGHDPVPVQSAKLSDDRKSVTLKLGPLVPAMQMAIKYQVKMDGEARTGIVYTTIQK